MARISLRTCTIAAAIGMVLALGFWLRSAHFSEWLYFKLDQSRDAMLISDAVEKGAEYLPLLGQRVGAIDLESGLLRVGPIYYYFQYISGTLFHSVDPWVFAYPDLLFGVLAILMIFFVARLAYSALASILVAFLLAVSFLGVEYSRFAWNPNPLPFFFLLAMFGMIRFANEPSGKRKYWFLGLWALGFGIGSQLHFFGMMSLVGVTALFLLWKYSLWRKESLREFANLATVIRVAKFGAVFMLVLFMLSVPIFANELLRGGENTRNFIEAMTKKQDAKPMLEGIAEAWSENSRYACLIVTSGCLTDSSRKNRIPLGATGLFLVAGIVAAGVRLKRLPEGSGKDLMRLIFVWGSVFFILSVPVAFQLRPRFFLVVLPIPLLLFGSLFDELGHRFRRAGFLVGGVIFAGIAVANIWGIRLWFQEQAAAQKGDAPVSRTIILKNKDGVTLGQLERAVDLIASKIHPGERLYFYVKPEHIAPIEYLFELKQPNGIEFPYETMKMNRDPKARFFAIVPAEQASLQSVTDKFGEPFSIQSFDIVGQIAVSEITFNGRTIDPEFQFKGHAKNEDVFWLDEKRRRSDRLFWGDVFHRKFSSQRNNEETETEEE